ncbi:hypothetical protein NQ318_012878 [Aromia moschata]|uniref:BED-type domain-containing protein n=1 Tax=Aromia moschata TaxID=1265417 RepID=A0AAV8YDP8_9CUCU|nr:hypothetical protein NQ318_012878 [Aromia moschata]
MKRNRREVFQTWLDSDPEGFKDIRIQGNDLFCTVCERIIHSSDKTKVTRHLKSHASSSADDSVFFYELTEAFVESNISLNKLENLKLHGNSTQMETPFIEEIPTYPYKVLNIDSTFVRRYKANISNNCCINNKAEVGISLQKIIRKRNKICSISNLIHVYKITRLGVYIITVEFLGSLITILSVDRHTITSIALVDRIAPVLWFVGILATEQQLHMLSLGFENVCYNAGLGTIKLYDNENLPAKEASQEVKYGLISMKRKAWLLGLEKMKKVYAAIHNNFLLVYCSDRDLKPMFTFNLKNFEAKADRDRSNNFELLSTFPDQKVYYELLEH